MRGVGGSQLIGQPKECSIKFDCLPGKWYHHQIHPTTIPGEQSLVLLGTDFLAKFDKTLIDWKKRISLGNSWVYLTDIGPPKVKLDISKNINDSQTQQIHQLVEAHPNLFAHNPKAPRQAKTGCHIINTKTELPHKDKVRRTPSKWKNDVEDQIKQMIENGICRESSSPYSSNILLTNKKDGTKRFCIDFRSLNRNTIKDTYPLPNVEDLIDSFKGYSYISQIDLASGYWGIPVNPKDVGKTAFATHMGKFEMLKQLSIDSIKAEQAKDKIISDATKQLSEVGQIRSGTFRPYKNIRVKDGILYKGNRIMAPKTLQEVIIREYHGQYHYGVNNTALLIKARFYWSGMDEDISRSVLACRTRIQAKSSRKQLSEMQIPEPIPPRTKLAIDIACMPRSVQGNAYILQMIDVNTKFVVSAALPDQQA